MKYRTPRLDSTVVIVAKILGRVRGDYSRIEKNGESERDETIANQTLALSTLRLISHK